MSRSASRVVLLWNGNFSKPHKGVQHLPALEHNYFREVWDHWMLARHFLSLTRLKQINSGRCWFLVDVHLDSYFVLV